MVVSAGGSLGSLLHLSLDYIATIVERRRNRRLKIKEAEQHRIREQELRKTGND
jgi:hypothetical protein